MTHARSGVCALAVLMLAACAASQPPTTTEAQAQSRCERVSRTGSNLPVLQCRPGATEDERQQDIDDWGRSTHGRRSSGGG
ncbi:MAG TPA: hypothetical protein VFF72_01085 [Caldimonas sp.]|nr:hypothetical protein [Caldimonas sp.]